MLIYSPLAINVETCGSEMGIPKGFLHFKSVKFQAPQEIPRGVPLTLNSFIPKQTIAANKVNLWSPYISYLKVVKRALYTYLLN